MAELGIACPLMIVKGDGTLALAETVALRPIETVLSGPAASLVGASWLCGLKDFIMSDMGGTTTDLGILVGGRPQVAEQGAEVGGWRTMVKAIDVRTIGLGGDSEIAIGAQWPAGGRAAARGAGLAHRRRAIRKSSPCWKPISPTPKAARCMAVSCCGRSVPRRRRSRPNSSPREAEILALVGERPQPMRKIAVSSAAQRALASLKRKGPGADSAASRRRTPPMCWVCRTTGRAQPPNWRPGCWCASAT